MADTEREAQGGLRVDDGRYLSFRYTEETGIVFSAPDFYVKNLIRRLMSCYGVSLKPIINEFK